MALIGVAASILLLLIFIRIMFVFLSTGKPVRNLCSSKPVSTLIILGSGGHTAEMMNLLCVLEIDKFSPRSYIAAATDNMSLQKAKVFEQSLAHGASAGNTSRTAKFMQIYRSREVGQSYVTSVGTTLVAMVHALWLILKIRPTVVLCNGPGTCVPLCVAAFLVKVVGIRWSFIFYVESIARVKKLSLSGLMLYKLHLADQFFVQWPKLQKAYPRAQYVGCLM
ncbi:UDP-N-acetylglucosamine transferase subunit ALG14 [Nymphaea colorata]|nr:UDP-N-acetylglucosamine transferase subunit ALG14 [Nymphaea colorata]XP_031482990.1 UDP-N-acetylglucosamine transferase subunit ALG14 [Nymphaea colorata]XP_031482991.1 UDP-N-acetylglucosamine transferase subunit ALG14 [Nymphaea colorata]XP_049933408.1 UDP-N-acetylglucosamine transferase subunit ALG14 [Nymphaea colorata]